MKSYTSKLADSYLIFVFIRYLTLKQILPQLEQFESGFEDELKWLDEALVALEAYKNVNTLDEVEQELQRYTVNRQCVNANRLRFPTLLDFHSPIS